MKTASERMRERLRKDRPMAAISLRMPEDVIEDLKEMARMENSQVQMLTESLRKHGIDDQMISAVIAEAQLKSV